MLRAMMRCAMLVLTTLALPAFGQQIIQPSDNRRGESSRGAARANGYLVQFVKGTSQGARNMAVLRAGATLRYNYATVDAVAGTVPNENALNALKGKASVIRVAPH